MYSSALVCCIRLFVCCRDLMYSSALVCCIRLLYPSVARYKRVHEQAIADALAAFAAWSRADVATQLQQVGLYGAHTG